MAERLCSDARTGAGVCVSLSRSGEPVSVTRMDAQGRVRAVIWQRKQGLCLDETPLAHVFEDPAEATEPDCGGALVGDGAEPQLDLSRVRAGGVAHLVEAMLAMVQGWMEAAHCPLSTAVPPSMVASLGAVPAAGLLAAGLDVLRLLSESPQGRQAMRKFGLQPVLEDVERE